MKLRTSNKVIKAKPLKAATLAALLKQGRESAGLTLRAVETDTGISNAQISLLEQGKTANPSARTFIKLVKLYKLPMNEAVAAVEAGDTE
jgi:transcriptional regulator with XRE-family HTH domain